MSKLRELLGEGIHTALRKASDHPRAHDAWQAINNLPRDEWSAVLDWLAAALESNGVVVIPPRPDAQDSLLSHDADLATWLAHRGLPEDASLSDLIWHERANARLEGVFMMMAAAAEEIENRG